MKDYINDYGLLNATLADINAENAPLWSIEYILLSPAPTLLENLIKYIDMCRIQKGLFNQFPFLASIPEDRYMSPDQLIAFLAAFKLINRTVCIENIWKYLVKHAFTYDNLQPNKINFERIMQPQAVLFCGALLGKTWCKVLLSILMVVSCLGEGTSGKLKAWVMFKTLGMKRTEKVCTYLVKSWKDVFYIYFKEENHPIRKVI